MALHSRGCSARDPGRRGRFAAAHALLPLFLLATPVMRVEGTSWKGACANGDLVAARLREYDGHCGSCSTEYVLMWASVSLSLSGPAPPPPPRVRLARAPSHVHDGARSRASPRVAKAAPLPLSPILLAHPPAHRPLLLEQVLPDRGVPAALRALQKRLPQVRGQLRQRQARRAARPQGARPLRGLRRRLLPRRGGAHVPAVPRRDVLQPRHHCVVVHAVRYGLALACCCRLSQPPAPHSPVAPPTTMRAQTRLTRNRCGAGTAGRAPTASWRRRPRAPGGTNAAPATKGTASRSGCACRGAVPARTANSPRSRTARATASAPRATRATSSTSTRACRTRASAGSATSRRRKTGPTSTST